MYSKNKMHNIKTPKPFIAILMLFFTVLNTFDIKSAYSQEKSNATSELAFSLKPIRCVTLHQGQACYQKLDFTWNTPGETRFCLFDATHSIEILCWNGNELSSHSMAFESDINIIYQIRADVKDVVLKEITVEVAWVYKSRRSNSSRWRLF